MGGVLVGHHGYVTAGGKDMSLFRFAILGAGKIARRFCDAAALVDGCAVTAVASKSMERARELAQEKGIPAAYDSYEEMLDRERPDCAYIATTCDSHFELAMLCVSKHVGVLCEKAMFTCSKEAETFFAESRKRGVFAMEALWSRFLPANLRAREWAASGRIGDVVLSEMNIGFAAPLSPDNRYFSPALGGGAANDLTVYALQLTTWILGREIASAQVAAVRSETGVDETNVVLLTMEGGALAALKSSLRANLNDQLAVYGTKGRIVVPHPHYASEALLMGPDGTVAERYVDGETKNGFTYEIGEAMARVRGGETESPVVPHASTLACARVFDQIRAALEGGKG